MNNTNNLPNTIILKTPPSLREVVEQLNQGWLFNIDMDALLDCCFACFNEKGKIVESMQELIKAILGDFYDTKEYVEGITQKQFIAEVTKQLLVNIEEYLKENGLLQNEYFQYEYKKILTDGSIQFAKIPRSDDIVLHQR